MRPLVLLSNRLPLFIEINRHCNNQGWFIHNTTNPDKTVELVNNNDVAGLILDLSAIGLNAAVETVKKIRNKINGPILVLSEKDEKKEKSLFYDLKVDSYLAEPLEYSEFMSKIRQLFWVYDKLMQNKDAKKLKVSDEQQLVKCDDLSLDFKHYRVVQDGVDIGLTPKEFGLLWYLLQHRGQVLSRDQLMEGVWGYDGVSSSRTVDIHISHLRDKLEDNPQSPRWIKTVRGFGYLLANDYPLVVSN
jgi:Response regulators consisting of a CheY-like receiver domain and a winged-helix DNA-binding domain